MANFMPQACERCWRRKQKCSRETPICLQCRKVAAPCIRRRQGSVIDPCDLGNGSYIESLKSRIHTLEARLEEIADDQRTSPITDPSPRSEHHNVLHDAMHEASYLPLSAMAEATDRQPFPAQGLSFLSLLFAATNISGANPSLPVGMNAALSGPLAEFRKRVFASDHCLESLEYVASFTTYTDRIGHSFPFMPADELNNLFNCVMHSYQSGHMEDMVNEKPDYVVIVYIGIATGTLLSSNYHFKEAFATQLAMKAVQLIPQVFNHASNLSIVQCLTALAIYSIFTTFGGSIWHILGLAITRCISAGYHTAHASDPNSGEEQKGKNGRAFWTLYILDTYVSTALDRPFCLNKEDIMTSTPSSPPRGLSTAATSSYRHLVQHAQMLRTLRQEPNTDVLCHFVNLRHWKDTLRPEVAQANPGHLYTYGLVELIKNPSFIHDAEQIMTLINIEHEFADHLKRFEEQLVTQSSAPAGLDSLHIFAIGVILLSRLGHPSASEPLSSREIRLQHISQAINILTLLSARYSSVRSLRDILAEFRSVLSSPSRIASFDRLQLLISTSEIRVPGRLQRLMFGSLEGQDIGGIGQPPMQPNIENGSFGSAPSTNIY